MTWAAIIRNKKLPDPFLSLLTFSIPLSLSAHLLHSSKHLHCRPGPPPSGHSRKLPVKGSWEYFFLSDEAARPRVPQAAVSTARGLWCAVITGRCVGAPPPAQLLPVLNGSYYSFLPPGRTGRLTPTHPGPQTRCASGRSETSPPVYTHTHTVLKILLCFMKWLQTTDCRRWCVYFRSRGGSRLEKSGDRCRCKGTCLHVCVWMLGRNNILLMT